MKREMNSPQGRVVEALRLAVAYRAIYHEIEHLTRSLGSDWDSDEQLMVTLDKAESLLQKTVGRIVMYGGLPYEQEMEAWERKAEKRGVGNAKA